MTHIEFYEFNGKWWICLLLYGDEQDMDKKWKPNISLNKYMNWNGELLFAPQKFSFLFFEKQSYYTVGMN